MMTSQLYLVDFFYLLLNPISIKTLGEKSKDSKIKRRSRYYKALHTFFLRQNHIFL